MIGLRYAAEGGGLISIHIPGEGETLHVRLQEGEELLALTPEEYATAVARPQVPGTPAHQRLQDLVDAHIGKDA